jgi:hypothetical protein
MPTKSTAKKSVKAKAPKASKTPKKASAAELSDRVISAAPVTEVFKTHPGKEEPVTVRPNAVLLFINGRAQGEVDTTNKTLGEFAVEHASRAGIKSFSLNVDGAKADSTVMGNSMGEYTKVEIVAKDTRG